MCEASSNSAEHCDRAEDEHLEQDDRWHRLQEGRPRDPGYGRLEERPDELISVGGRMRCPTSQPVVVLTI